MVDSDFLLSMLTSEGLPTGPKKCDFRVSISFGAPYEQENVSYVFLSDVNVFRDINLPLEHLGMQR